MVTFATPYAMFIFQQYGRSIPIELDESARIDGASPMQIYFKHLSAADGAGTGRGRHLCAAARLERVSCTSSCMLSDKRSMTVPVALAAFLNSDEAPWNYMMATAIVYAVLPIAIYYLVRGRMTAGLTVGGVKG